MEILWRHLTSSPLLWLFLTLLTFQFGSWLHRRFNRNPLLNPTLISICCISVVLTISDTRYEIYLDSTQFIHFLLGPATVALAIPLYKEIQVIRQAFIPLSVALIAGSLTAILSSAFFVWLMQGHEIVLHTLAPKSVTTPIAMGISEKIGGIPSVTAVAVIFTGIAGAVLGDYVFRLLNVTDKMAQGMALGVASHGIGTAYAIQKNLTIGAFAALGMALNGVVTSILIAGWASFSM